MVDGANWEYPLGKNNTIASDNHPVTQVSWNDALAYCEFCDKTLPSEIQWEYAASEMGKKKNQLYYWGMIFYMLTNTCVIFGLLDIQIQLVIKTDLNTPLLLVTLKQTLVFLIWQVMFGNGAIIGIYLMKVT